MPEGPSQPPASAGAGLASATNIAPSKRSSPVRGDAGLAAKLARAIEGEVLFDPFSRGRYATDASIYQIEPIGVVIPKSASDVAAAITIAREAGAPVLPRGAGTSQCGQTVGEALVLDTSRHMKRILALDVDTRRVTVEPGIVLDHLNAALKPHGLFYPVDVSPANRATIGGMTGNNSCGSRSIRYGNMVHNVHAVDLLMADGTTLALGPVGTVTPAGHPLVQAMRALHANEAEEIAKRYPKLLRKVGGYNIEMIGGEAPNMAALAVGSEGTLGFFTAITLDLQPIPRHKTLGVCHFPRFYDAMAVTRHIVALKPAAVELVDRTMIDLSRDIPAFRPTVDRFVRGAPDALLLVEFAADEADGPARDLKRLVELLADLGFPGAVVEVTDTAFQKEIWEVRAAGLNIMMSMKGEGKPVSFIEDCAVPLEDLAEYTSRLTEVFRKHGTDGTWYAHASVGCLHVRPILNLKDGADVKKMRAIAEEAFAMVRAYKGYHSGEHGDGLVRSEFHEAMFGARIVRAFEMVKDGFDPGGLFNPGKIVRPSKMDDRSLFRYKPDYRALPFTPVLDWSHWGGFLPAVEMCNNNGTCRKSDPGVMCPSFRATGNERDVTRGRANTLRLALTGQLGPDALTSQAMAQALDLCLACKGCKRECPTGVDMAKMKIEVKAAAVRRHGLSLADRLIAYLPRYAPVAARFAGLMNLRNRLPWLARRLERPTGFSAQRALPEWSHRPFIGRDSAADGREVVLFVDTFTRYFDPDTAAAAQRVLEAAGCRVRFPENLPTAAGRPLCCGRTFLTTGAADAAKAELQRLLDTLAPLLEAGLPVIGLEPSCLLAFRDELPALLPGAASARLARQSVLLEEFLAAEHAAGRLALPLKPIAAGRALLHGHCHQKAMGVMGPVETVLRLVPGLAVEVIASGCCGMAGAFGYQSGHAEISLQIAEQALFPAIRKAPEGAIIVADGTSCRHQIADGLGREALHVARVLAMAL